MAAVFQGGRGGSKRMRPITEAGTATRQASASSSAPSTATRTPSADQLTAWTQDAQVHGPGEPLGQAQGEPLVAAGHPEGLAGREAGPGVAEDGRGQLPDRLAGRDLEPGGDRLPGPRVEGQLGQHGRHRAAGGGQLGPVGQQLPEPGHLGQHGGPVGPEAAAGLAVAVGHARRGHGQAEAPGGGDQRPVVVLDELGPELDHGPVAQPAGVDPAPDPLPGLQDQRLQPALGQGHGRGQPGEPGPDHAHPGRARPGRRLLGVGRRHGHRLRRSVHPMPDEEARIALFIDHENLVIGATGDRPGLRHRPDHGRPGRAGPGGGPAGLCRLDAVRRRPPHPGRAQLRADRHPPADRGGAQERRRHQAGR